MFLSGVQVRSRLDSRLKHAGMTDREEINARSKLCGELDPVEIETCVPGDRLWLDPLLDGADG